MNQVGPWAPYCGAAPVPEEWLTRWNLDPLLLIVMALAALLSWRSGGAERKAAWASSVMLGLLLFVSPFCALTSALFSARVVHHVLLTAVLAPMLVVALPRLHVRYGSLPLWTAAHGMIFWVWHAPAVYAWALSSDAAYWLMQLSLVGSAVGLWAAIRRAEIPGAIGALLATMVQMGLLGALITFAGSPLYAPHLLATASWGLTPFEDQQVAGLIMWVPGAALYLAGAVLLMSRWFAQQDRQVTAR